MIFKDSFLLLGCLSTLESIITTGAVSSAADIVRERHIAAEFSPQISPAERQDRLDSWHRAVKAAAVFSE